MKLKNKLFVNFTVLFFFLLNIFSYFLIQTIYINSIDKAVDSGFKEYAVIYSNLKSGENMSRLFFTDKDVIRIKTDAYMSNGGTETLDIEVRDSNKKIIYSTMLQAYPIPDGMEVFADKDKINYVIVNKDGDHKLIINKEVSLNEVSYQLSYINDIENLYQDRLNYFLILLLFDVIGGILSVFAIYFFASEITKPLHSFIENINEVIHKHDATRLDTTSNIVEINELSSSFNVMNDEISSQIKLLETQNQEKQRFIDSLTHEIRTPLTSIIGYSSLYLNNKITDSGTMKASFNSIYQNGKRIESLTENLIKLITLDKSKLDIKEQHMIKILSDVQKTLDTRLNEQNIEFTIVGNDFIINSDEYLLSTLFFNFLDNAIKATEAKDNRKIEVVLEEQSVSIRDNGKGIPEEDLNKIFEPFFMVDKSREKTLSGFGLGLSICRNIMEILNIQFAIESEVHIYTKITLNFTGGAYETL